MVELRAKNNQLFSDLQPDQGLPAVDAVWQIMTELASCLCAELASSGLPEPCFCGIFPGEQAPFDFCACDSGGCGQAWVRLAAAGPSSFFPTIGGTSGLGSCAAQLAFQFDVGVLRCAPMPDDQGSPPTMSAQFEAAQLQYADMMAMRRAIVCCARASKRGMDLGQYTPTGPQGGCLGGVWAVAFSEI